MSENLVIPVALQFEDGLWSICAPDFDGCFSQGETAEEAIINIQDSITGWLDVRREEGWRIPDISEIGYWAQQSKFQDGNWLWAISVMPRPDWWPHATNV